MFFAGSRCHCNPGRHKEDELMESSAERVYAYLTDSHEVLPNSELFTLQVFSHLLTTHIEEATV
jgi:hypothetical protein